MTSVFAAAKTKHFPHTFNGELTVRNLFGGIPSDPRIIEGWLKKTLLPADDVLQEEVAKTMDERGASFSEAVDEQVAKNLCGFKRDPDSGELYLEGRCLKAAIKEAANVAAAAGRLELRGYGKTNKGLMGFIAEHVFVVEEKLYLGVKEPSGINQDQVHTFRGSSLQYNEYVDFAKITFTVIADWDWTPEQWEAIWVTGEEQGLGASRSQGRGRYEVTKWEAAKAARRSKATTDAAA